MNFLKKINGIRRLLMQGLTKKLGSSNIDSNIDLSIKPEIKKVLIIRPNHRLGNLLLITPIVQEVQTSFPDCKIDLFAKGNLAPIVFQNYENINLIIKLPKKPFNDLFNYFKGWVAIKSQQYDIVINIDRNSSSGRMSTKLVNAKYKLFGDLSEDITNKYKDYEHIAKYPVYELRLFLSKFGFPINDKKIPSLDIKLSSSEIVEGKKSVLNLVNNQKKTICIFTYATGDKCYSETWWEKFYDRLIVEFPDYNIIEILPIENISKINFKAPTFYSKDIREMAGLIANTEVFIGADSGIMHLASAAQTTTVGLFSVSNLSKYQPYSNNSFALDTNTGDLNDWFKELHKIIK